MVIDSLLNIEQMIKNGVFMEQYNKKTMEHFMNPKNMGEIADADGIGEVGNIKCGDVMHIFIRVGTRIKKNQKSKIKDKNYGSHSVAGLSGDKNGTEEYIKDIKFKTLGCAAAIASSSMTTELAKEKSLDEALKISKDDINEALGKLPAPKYHCSILAAEGIKRAIEDYRGKKQ